MPDSAPRNARPASAACRLHLDDTTTPAACREMNPRCHILSTRTSLVMAPDSARAGGGQASLGQHDARPQGSAAGHTPYASCSRNPRGRRTLLHALRRHGRHHQPHPHHPEDPAGRGLQPRRPEPCTGELRDSRVHRQRQRPGDVAAARGDAHPRTRGHAPLLPGPDLGDVGLVREVPQRETTLFKHESLCAARRS